MKKFYNKISKLLLLVVFLIGFGQVGLGQWTTVATDNFDNFPTGFTQSGFSNQGYGAEVGGSSDKCAYDKNVGSSPTSYVSKQITLESGYIYRFSYMAKRGENPSCGATLRYATNTGNGGTDVSSEFTPPKRLGTEAGDTYVSDEITGDGNSYYLKISVTTGNSSDVKLRIDGFKVERKAASTGTSTLSAGGGAEPGTISSLTNTQGTSSLNFDFTFNEGDGAAAEISQIVFNQATGDAFSDWTEAILGAELVDNDGTPNSTTSVTIGATSLTFGSLAYASGDIGYIAANASKTYTLKIWLKPSLGGTLPTTIDGKDFVFEVTNSSFTFNSGGLAASQSVNSGDGNNVVDVNDTELRFVQQPTNTATNGTMSPAVTIEATDANGNRDLDNSSTVSLASSGTMGVVADINLTNGFGTFGNIVHSVAGTGLVLTASTTGLTDGTSSTFVIADDPCSVGQNIPFTEDFESGTWPPACWNVYELADAAGWLESTTYAHSTTRAAFHNDDDVSSGVDDWLITPPLDFSTLNDAELVFWQYVNYGSYAEKHAVKISTNTDGTPGNGTWTEIYNTIGTEDTWEEITIDISSYIGNSDVYIAFQYTGDNASEWWVDDIGITGSSCTTPTNPATLGSTDNIGSDRMDVNWTRGDGDNVIVIARQGSAVAFTPTDLNTYTANSSFGSGTDLGSGEYCVYNGSGTSVTVTGLAGSTDYYFAVYEYGCSAGSELYLTSSPATASGTTLAPAPEINVIQAGTDYLHNTTYDFGTIGVGSNSPITFTIENNGNASLTFTTPLTEGGSADYSVTTQPTSGIAGGGTSDFVVTFAPTSIGTITGSVSIDNNDATDSEDPYVINFTGVGSPSNVSDIIVVDAFDEPDNIDYTAYLEANLTSASLEVAQFSIRDGGATNDADGEVTELTDITFSVLNSANLQRVAIYDGTTEIAEVAAGASITFSGISLSAIDNGEKTFSLRASFNTTVTDNQHFQFTVTSATANSATSTFAAADAGGAFSSIAGADNRIKVEASDLDFGDQPSNTNVDATMSPVTVIAVDDELNIDLDYTGSVTITSTSANMTGDPISVNASSGTATFSSIVHTVAGTGYKLTATATGLVSDESSLYDITEFVYAAGDYRSTVDGTNFSWNNNAGATNNWEYYDGSSWGPTPGDKAPQNAVDAGYSKPSRIIINNINVDAGGNATNSYNDIIILDGGELIANNWAANPSILFISSGKMLEVQSGGVFKIQGNFKIASDGNFIVRSGGTMIINEPNMKNDEEIWEGEENFEAGSYVEFQDWGWDSGSMDESLVNVRDAITDNSNGYKFGYFKVNSTTLGTANWALIGGPVGIIDLCYNDLTIITDGTGYIQGIVNKTGTNGFTINGNLIVNSGNFTFSSSYSSAPYIHQATINGDFEYNGSENLMLHYNALNTPTEMSNYVTFKGNVYVAPTATIANDVADNGDYMYINFDGTSDVDIETSLSHTDMYVKSGATANLVYDMDLTGTNSILTVDNGGVWQIMPTINMTAPSGGIVNNAGSTGFVIKSDVTGTGSLIQQDAFAATYERYLTGGTNVWHDIFSPLSSASLPAGYAFSYDESKHDIWNMTTNFGWDGSDFVANNSEIGWTSASSFATTQGYILNSTATQTASLTGGNLEVSDKTFNVQTTTHTGTIPISGNDPNGVSYSGCVDSWNDYDGWIFVGNPYASALDWSVAYTGDVDIESGIYIWDDGAKNYKYFLDPDGLNSTFTVGIDVNGDENTKYIPSGQGFFVKSVGASGSFTIPATARTHTTHTFWKDKEILPNLLRLNISKDDFTDETVLFSVEGATDDFDGGFDLHKRFSMDALVPQIYSLNNEQSQFALNSFPEFTGHKIVPLGVYIGETGEYSINVTENNFANTHIWLEDRALEIFTNFTMPSSYTFNQTTEINNDRFYLHFDQNTTPYSTFNIPDQTTLVDEYYSYFIPQVLFADANFGDEITISVAITNGNELPNWLSYDENTGTFSGIPSDTATWNIRFTATDLFGATTYEDFKLVVYKNPTNIPNAAIEKMIAIYPNPTHDIVNVTIPDILSNTTITIFDASGRMIINQNATSSNNSIDVSNLSQGIYLIEIKDDISFTRKKLIIK